MQTHLTEGRFAVKASWIFSSKSANFRWTVTQTNLCCRKEAQNVVGFTPGMFPAALQAYRDIYYINS